MFPGWTGSSQLWLVMVDTWTWWREREEKREEGEGRIEREEEGVCSSKIVESTVLHWCTDKEFEMSCYLLKIRAR